ncbi:PREDICTED: G protein-regulated inducer of neurite outgrowth 3 [Gekko japonicus]|uniref:G protein-regulated inducer of neurite outgrowth 3 n=1 Tax=Gekko japonicus TaxID=146911 RepID=A0ABM1KID0_GEKJA|nr:PREDICTED: G protein-regulated inducer of neurite outgrowth 3 [Gekko japonicus]
MGTVPDPLRSARLSSVAAPEEKNGLREPQSPKRPCKQASIERNGNGFPLTAKTQPAGDHLLGMSRATIEDKPKDEKRCGYDTNQASMFSAGSLSPSKGGHLTMPEPARNSEREGSRGSRDLAVAEGHAPVQTGVKRLPTQEASEILQGGDRGQFCRAIDKANSTLGDGVKGSEARGCSSPCLQPTPQQASPAVKETVGEKSAPERTHLSVKESEAVSDLGVKSPVCIGAELMDGKDAELTDGRDASPCPRAEVAPETEHKPNLESAPQSSCKTETEEKAVAELSKFKDTGTMTVQTDSGSEGREMMQRGHQDAGVQAVASVENKSSSTSPSIFAAFLQESVHSEAKQKQEQLHIIYTGGGGKEQSEIVDGFAPLLQTASPMGIMPEVHVQAAATVDTSGTQAVRLQSDPVGMHDTVCSALSDNGKHPCSLTSDSARETPVNRVEAQRAGTAGSRGDSQQPSDSSVLLKTRPVYQITVNSSNQPTAPLQPVKVETKLPPSAGNDQASPSCCRVSEQAARTAVGTHDSRGGQHLQIQTVSNPETGPASSHTDVKPKREEKFTPLRSKELEVSKMGAAAGPQTGCSPGTGKREQHKFPEHHKEVKLESESRRSPVPARGLQVAKGGEMRKEAKMVSPAQHRLNLSGNKKEPKPAAEAKAQLKQSKRVRDVVWDEQGMTWEVYGASLDPESLGIAIQNHLQRQIREHEKLIKSQSAQNRKSISSDTSSNKKLKGRQHNVFQSMLQNFRRPNCCVRPTASSVLD